MKRTLIAVVLTLGLASSAWGASLSLQVADVNGGGPGAIAPGDSFTLELLATVDAGEIAFGLDVRVLGDGAVTWAGATQVGLTSFGGAAPWSEFPPICTGGDPCVAVNQANPNPLSPFGADAFDGVIATIMGTANAGAAAIRVEATDFFGLGGDGGVTPIQIVPEPTTVALMGLGLLGLSVAGRRR